MASTIDVKRLGLGLLAVLVAAALIFFGTGLQPHWPLMWFAPLPVLLFAADASWWGAALVGALAIMLGLGNLWGLFHQSLHVPWLILVQIYLGEGVVYSLAVLLYRWRAEPTRSHRGISTWLQCWRRCTSELETLRRCRS
jgi:apolipoprotein N-acyltransferase